MENMQVEATMKLIKILMFLLIIFSLLLLPLVIISDIREKETQHVITIFEGRKSVIIQNSHLKLSFDKEQGFALNKLETPTGEDLLQAKACYAVGMIGNNIWSDIYDTNATLSFLNTSSSQVVLMTEADLISSRGNEPIGMRVEKLYTIFANTSFIDVEIKVTVTSSSPLIITNWFLEFMASDGYKYWAYEGENTINIGEYNKSNSWMYRVNSLKWMAFYGGAREYALGLIFDSESIETRASSQRDTIYGSYDGPNPAGELYWSLPNMLYPGDEAYANVTIFITYGDFSSINEYVTMG